MGSTVRAVHSGHTFLDLKTFDGPMLGRGARLAVAGADRDFASPLGLFEIGRKVRDWIPETRPIVR